ncbi:MAG TPA: RHS repeat-associated core domain-containing protein [Terriglobia bacterium]|nr:RHS repeat-associated core domain-containing protein [Terriglobia bacterium]
MSQPPRCYGENDLHFLTSSAQVAGQRLNMGGANAYIDHADAVGSTTMETDPAGGVQWDIVRYPWGQIWQQTGTRQSAVFGDLDWQVNDPLRPSATREYSANVNRWMTPDPGGAGSELTDSQSWDMYSYADDNPTTDSDPGGLDCLHFSPSPGGINVGVESGSCSGSGGVYVNGTVDVDSFTYNGSELGYSYAPYSGGSGAGVIGFGAPASSSDLSPFALEALPLTGSWASAGIRNAAITMGINGALVGVDVLLQAGVDTLTASEEAAGASSGAEESTGRTVPPI